MDVLRQRAGLAAPVARRGSSRFDWALVAQRAPAVLVIASGCASAIWIAVQLLRRDDVLGTPAYDQAFFQQVIWNLDAGHGFVSSFNQNSFLGVHFSPLVLIPAALELAWADPRMLTLINSAAVALSAPAAFLFLRAAFSPSRLGPYLAAGLAAALPFTPTMQEAARAGYHTEAIALPAALIAGWAGLTHRLELMWVTAAIPLLAKEDQVYAVAVIGLLVAARGRPGMRLHGVLLAITAVMWGMALFLVIMPVLRDGAPLETGQYYIWLGSGATALLAPIRDPTAVWTQLSNMEGWTNAAVLIACCCGLPLLRLRWALFILPPLLANLLSRHYPQPELHLQYGLPLVVPALVATAMGGRAALVLAERLRRRRHAIVRVVLPRLKPALLAAAAPGLLLGAMLGSLPPAAHASAMFAREPGLSRLASITAIIPASAPVAADNDAAPSVASRQRILVLPSQCLDCYVVVDRVISLQSFMTPDERAVLLAGLSTNRRLLADDGRFQVWSPVNG